MNTQSKILKSEISFEKKAAEFVNTFYTCTFCPRDSAILSNAYSLGCCSALYCASHMRMLEVQYFEACCGTDFSCALCGRGIEDRMVPIRNLSKEVLRFENVNEALSLVTPCTFRGCWDSFPLNHLLDHLLSHNEEAERDGIAQARPSGLFYIENIDGMSFQETGKRGFVCINKQQIKIENPHRGHIVEINIVTPPKTLPPINPIATHTPVGIVDVPIVPQYAPAAAPIPDAQMASVKRKLFSREPEIVERHWSSVVTASRSPDTVKRLKKQSMWYPALVDDDQAVEASRAEIKQEEKEADAANKEEEKNAKDAEDCESEWSVNYTSNESDSNDSFVVRPKKKLTRKDSDDDYNPDSDTSSGSDYSDYPTDESCSDYSTD